MLMIELDSEGKVTRFVRGHLPHQTNPIDAFNQAINVGFRCAEVTVNWCKRDQCFYAHEVGSWTGWPYLHQLVQGARGKVWLDSAVTGGRDNEPLTPEQINALGYEILPDRPTLPNLAYDSDCYYCERCDDMIPDDDPCDHVYWCNECGMSLDKQTEACEHYCDRCEWEKGYYDCELDCGQPELIAGSHQGGDVGRR